MCINIMDISTSKKVKNVKYAYGFSFRYFIPLSISVTQLILKWSPVNDLPNIAVICI